MRGSCNLPLVAFAVVQVFFNSMVPVYPGKDRADHQTHVSVLVSKNACQAEI